MKKKKKLFDTIVKIGMYVYGNGLYIMNLYFTTFRDPPICSSTIMMSICGLIEINAVITLFVLEYPD